MELEMTATRRLVCGIVMAYGGVVLFVVMFLPWYGLVGLDRSIDAWKAFSLVDLVLMVAGLTALGVGITIAVLFRASLSRDTHLALGWVSAAWATLALLMVIIRLIEPPGAGAETVVVPGVGEVETGLRITREVGAFVSIVPSLVIIGMGLLFAAGSPARTPLGPVRQPSPPPPPVPPAR